LFGFFAADSYHYDQLALKIASGNLLFKDSVYIGAGYPLFLFLIYLFLGRSFLAVALVQVGIDSLTTVLIYLICLKISPKKVIGLLAALLYGLSATAIFYTGFLLDTTLSAFLGVSLIFSLLNTKESSSLAWFKK